MTFRSVRIGIALVVCACLAGAAWTAWRSTHPTLFASDSNMLPGGSTAPTTVDKGVVQIGVAGHPWRKPFGDPLPEETITFKSASAHFRTNGAGVRVKFSICSAKDTDNAIGVVDEPLERHCSTVRPLRDGTTMRFGSMEYVVATLTPRKPGTSVLDSVTLDYARSGGLLHQSGKERLHGGLTIQITR